MLDRFARVTRAERSWVPAEALTLVADCDDIRGWRHTWSLQQCGVPVGFARLECGGGGVAALLLWVHPAYRRRGVGSTALGALTAARAARGAEAFEAVVAGGNVAALSLLSSWEARRVDEGTWVRFSWEPVRLQN